MNHFEDAILALQNYLSNENNIQLDDIIKDVNKINFEGPTVAEFIKTTEALNYNIKYRFGFGINPRKVCSEPPEYTVNLKTSQTPNYNLESFFFVTSHHNGKSRSSCFCA